MRNTIILITLLLPGLFTCKPPQAIKNTYICDDYGAKGCTQPQKSPVTYQFNVPSNKSTTWRDLSYHMYFHSRETPGIRVNLEGSLPETDRQILRKSLKCSYRLEKGERFVSGHLEGRRIDTDYSGFWCFDYLGTMLLEFHKKYKSLEKPPKQSFFPVRVILQYHSKIPQINGQLIVDSHVKWTKQ